MRGADMFVMDSAAYSLTAALHGMREALAELAIGRTAECRINFDTILDVVGFDDYSRLVAGHQAEQGEDAGVI